MLLRWPLHEHFAAAIRRFYLHALRQIQPGLVRHNCGLETSVLELVGDVHRCVVILLRPGDMGHSRQALQFLAGKSGIGHCKELTIDLSLRSEVAITK